ncbi:MAG: hypothetical protein COB98_04140 [Flavobacteriaceae bacterium]|nr:MAG: hypothetical protein COB98_04140 [Flavobacteriaceae bacterium]
MAAVPPMRKKMSIVFLLFCAISMAQSDAIEILKNKIKIAPVTAIIYADSLLLLPKSTITKKERNSIYYYRAVAYQDNKNHLKALELLKDMEHRFDPSDKFYTKVFIVQSHSNVALKNYSIATDQALKGLDAAKNNNFFSLVASAYSSLSYIEYSNRNYVNSYEYLLTSIASQKKEKDSFLLSATYNNLAIIYRKSGMFEKALNASVKSLEIDIKQKNNVNIGSSYCNIGDSYLLLNDKKKAKEYFLKAISHNKKENISNSIPYQNIGDFYYKNSDYIASSTSYSKALGIELKKGNQYRITDLYDQLLTVSIKLKDVEKIFLYKTKFDSIQYLNSIQQGNEKVKMLENQHKLFWNEKELEQIKTINTKNKIIFIVVLLMVLLVAIVLFFKIKNNSLYLAKEKLILEQTVLRSQMNPHFIFNALTAIQNSLLDNDPLKSASYISRFSKLIRQNFDFIDKNVIPLADEIDALRNYMDTQQLRFESRFTYEINVSETIDTAIVTIPPLLIQPFIENAIEHGFKNKKEKGKIQLRIFTEDDLILYEVKDNGSYQASFDTDGKVHAIDIFKKRLKLRGFKEEESFSIIATATGTLVKFALKT